MHIHDYLQPLPKQAGAESVHPLIIFTSGPSISECSAPICCVDCGTSLFFVGWGLRLRGGGGLSSLIDDAKCGSLNT